MLSEILFASVKREEKEDRVRGLSISSLFPCAYRLLLAERGELWQRKEPNLEPRQILNMEDGWDQEEQTVKRLARAGVVIEDRLPAERRVRIGKSNVPGSFDGTVTPDRVKYLWEHKAMNSDNFRSFVRYGLDRRPGIRAQVQGYMQGKGIGQAIVMAKYKDSNDYHDIVEEYDGDYIGQIMNLADRIRTDGWVPEPELMEWCAYCDVGCFGTVLDLSWVKTAITSGDGGKYAEQWKNAKSASSTADLLMDEARAFFVGVKDKKSGEILSEGLIGEADMLLAEGLKIQKVVQHRTDVIKAKVLQEFGPEGWLKVTETREIVTYRIGEDKNES